MYKVNILLLAHANDSEVFTAVKIWSFHSSEDLKFSQHWRSVVFTAVKIWSFHSSEDLKFSQQWRFIVISLWVGNTFQTALCHNQEDHSVNQSSAQLCGKSGQDLSDFRKIMQPVLQCNCKDVKSDSTWQIISTFVCMWDEIFVNHYKVQYSINFVQVH